MSTALERASRQTKTIEKLAAALEKASTVGEIKDVRDRAFAVQQYTRRKEGGLKAAQAAGRIVTAAHLKIAELYDQEQSAKDDGLKRGGSRGNRDSNGKPGKGAVAEAAGMHRGQLNGLGHVLEATDRQREKAMAAIEARGEIVSPPALARELAPTPPKIPDVRLGRSTEEFQAAVHVYGFFAHAMDKLGQYTIKNAVRGCTESERKDLAGNARTLRAWIDDLLKEVERV